MESLSTFFTDVYNWIDALVTLLIISLDILTGEVSRIAYYYTNISSVIGVIDIADLS